MIIYRIILAIGIGIQPAFQKWAEIVGSLKTHQDLAIAAVALAQGICVGERVIPLTIEAKHGLAAFVFMLPIRAIGTRNVHSV
ncbi:hypothetical protein D3C76_1409020 [compost metagenome]